MLSLECWLMVEFEEGFFDVAWHPHVNGAGCIVPLQCEATVECACPVSGDGVQV
jgi:hypothetical protein